MLITYEHRHGDPVAFEMTFYMIVCSTQITVIGAHNTHSLTGSNRREVSDCEPLVVCGVDLIQESK